MEVNKEICQTEKLDISPTENASFLISIFCTTNLKLCKGTRTLEPVLVKLYAATVLANASNDTSLYKWFFPHK